MNEYILSSNYILQTIGEDTVLLPCGLEKEVDLSQMIVLNETGAFLMGCIENDYISFERISELMKENFTGLPEKYEQELMEFIEDMVSKGVITPKIK